jgi:hypothetical protein
MARKALANNKVALELTAKHTHAGRDYPPGTVLVLADVELHHEAAQWLVNLKRARWVEPPSGMEAAYASDVQNAREIRQGLIPAEPEPATPTVGE